ncbi:MAG: hypothetical protein U0L51_00635 [Olegusella sp.]|nr:hypothetical protein [Olegusella sp.]
MAAEVHQAGKAASKAEREQLIAEADRQTQAIMRLEVYKRLAYTGVVAGALLIYWENYLKGAAWFVPAGIALLAVCGFASVILTVGIGNAKKNVKAIMVAAGVDLDSVPLGNPDKDSKVADAIRRANTKAEGFLERHGQGDGADGDDGAE